ncbi:hypothetical protein KFK09_022776 [Dendrobium nobile]|uniref:Reverse transcriptase domain-containing protein n=1 Tax=Dendrobium nobile TaxID=94219 RepID=A0A8T3AJA1_DENNO|nr:hypothetical protein KFK09_022776 [Dendrobium nobile]
MEEGEKNTRYYHTFAIAKKRSNQILQIAREDGTLESNQESFHEIMEKFFLSKWSKRSCNLKDWPKFKISDCIHEDMANILRSDFTKEELKVTLKSMDSNKSPGADGANAYFCKNYWCIVQEATWNAIEEFYKTGRMPEKWKETVVVLIPKIQNAKECSKFRPICLCQTVYKLAAGMILNRFKNCLPKVISEYQGAFVLGRSISDNCFIAQEIISKMKSSVAKPGYFLLKLDMEHAYDSMCWETLNQVMKLTHFLGKLIQLIMQCVSYPKFSIVINGKRTKWINAQCVFRQGCPLSPSLFILCFDLLSKALYGNNDQLGMRIATNVEKITHLLFADDVLVVAKAYSKNVRTLKKILKNYCGWTGQAINSQKSMVLYGKKVTKKRRRKLNKIMGFKEVKELNYLGIKLALRRLKAKDYNITIDKAMSRLNSWGERWLSLAGRILLIKRPYSNMISYQVAHSLIPKSILMKIDKICRNFLWHNENGNQGMHYIAWPTLCLPTCLGGFGIQGASERH